MGTDHNLIFEHSINHSAKVSHDHNIFTTPSTFAFIPKIAKTLLNIVHKHKHNLITIKLVNPFTNFITKNKTIVHYPNEFPIGDTY